MLIERRDFARGVQSDTPALKSKAVLLRRCSASIGLEDGALGKQLSD
jgi:hypothetical protein